MHVYMMIPQLKFIEFYSSIFVVTKLTVTLHKGVNTSGVDSTSNA